ncbi:M23 family metallopeptidase [Pyxidicoccus fallax]|uniref:M23 family metallopeptidase n=1 Tax=Pyxidicoccus fallax TaxID=394095 RepID=A0A848L9F8_9BACT|nr:M23 family metallopeptidase [Pyxidicoccus fallax]NMO15207.1 M23 family metallopeptidase [Pyxidicoccus fallax]NPC76906.1 M23 family metallopeptidase [Pyxidicoccus fallax]
MKLFLVSRAMCRGVLTALSLLMLTLHAPAAHAQACTVDCSTPGCINQAEGFPMRTPWTFTSSVSIGRAYGSGWHCAKDYYSLDFYLPLGTPVYPVAPGRIFQKGTGTAGYGNYVMVDHQNGYQSLYAHLRDPVTLENGRLVGTHEVIGYVGSTGTNEVHLHLTLYQGAQWPGDANAVGVVPETMRDCLLNGSSTCSGLVTGNTVTRTSACDTQSQCAQCILSVRNDILRNYRTWGWDPKCQNWDAIVTNWCGPTMDASSCTAIRNNQCQSLCTTWAPPVLQNGNIEATSASQHGFINSWGPRGAWAFHTSYPKPNNGDLGSKFGYYSAGTTETVGQLLSARFVANTRYVFSSRASGGLDNLGRIPYQIGYASVDNNLGSFVLLNSQTVNIDNVTGWVQTQGVSYTTPFSGGPIGKQIIVRLGDGSAGGASDIWFDNFTLTTSAP